MANDDDQPAQAPKPPDQPDLMSMIGRGVVPPMLYDPKKRADLGLPEDDATPGRYMIELNILYRGGLGEAAKAFERLCNEVLGPTGPGGSPPKMISKSYVKLTLSVDQWRRLLKEDDDRAIRDPGLRVIYKLWPDFKVKALIDRSIPTVKADAAVKAYAATGQGITWAVIDSGIDGTHPHFGTCDDPQNSVIHHPQVADLHYDFVEDGENGENGAVVSPPQQPGATKLTEEEEREQDRLRRAREAALRDDLGHGTHVAGIISGGLPATAKPVGTPAETPGLRYRVYEQVFEADPEGQRVWGKLPVERRVRQPEALHGVAPQCWLVSLKVLDSEGAGRVSDVMRALVHVREQLNDDPKMLRVHGVNLSLGYDFDAQMFACGQSPLCVEVDRLVRSGVVVVTAAGNTGYGAVGSAERNTKTGLSNTINDPGNAALAITVGSTHRDSPHTFGVSYFSSKGPTGDGRLKPDLVAPGERITSCAAKAKRDSLGINIDGDAAVYVDDSGTSMAAPHVSGAIAAFLSIRREFIQRPEDVKKIFLDSATSLGRERYFEGHGLVDLMRAIQSV
jgi:subtilisin family serine protease